MGHWPTHEQTVHANVKGAIFAVGEYLELISDHLLAQFARHSLLLIIRTWILIGQLHRLSASA